MSMIFSTSLISLTRDCSAPFPMVMAPKTMGTADLDIGGIGAIVREYPVINYSSDVLQTQVNTR